MAHHRDHPSNDSEQRNLLDDARVLLDRYRSRNDPARRLTPEQRREWAYQMADVMARLGKVVAAQIGSGDYRADKQRHEAWLHQFTTGFRPAKPLPQDPETLRPPPPFWKRNGQSR